jgi:hypothetical protein
MFLTAFTLLRMLLGNYDYDSMAQVRHAAASPFAHAANSGGHFFAARIGNG